MKREFEIQELVKGDILDRSLMEMVTGGRSASGDCNNLTISFQGTYTCDKFSVCDYDPCQSYKSCTSNQSCLPYYNCETYRECTSLTISV